MKNKKFNFINKFMAGIFSTTTAIVQGDVGEEVNEALNYGTLSGLGTRDLRAVIFSLINIILGFLTIVAIVIILLGGIRWMLSGGNEDKVSEAKNTIIAGIVGLIIIFISYSLASFVVRSLVNVTT